MDNEGRHDFENYSHWSADDSNDQSGKQSENQLPPPIPEEARKPWVHEQPVNKVLFDDKEFKQTPQKTINELMRQEREEETERQILEAATKLSLSPEVRVQLLQSQELRGILDYRGTVPTPQEAAAYLKEAAASLAQREQAELKKLGLRFDAENTVILDKQAEALLKYDDIKNELRKIQELHELQYVLPKSAAGLKKVNEIPPSAETITDHVYQDFKALGIDNATIDNALSHDLLEELEQNNYVSGKINVIQNAIDKLIRKAENTGKFKLDLYDDPQPIGVLGKLWNGLRGGRTSQDLKKTREYHTILSLQALRDAITSSPTHATKYPALENFANPITTNQTKSVRTSRPQLGRWATGLATAGVIGAAVSPHEQGRQVDATSEAAPATTYKMPERSPATDQMADTKITPRVAETNTNRTARRYDIETTNPVSFSKSTDTVAAQAEAPVTFAKVEAKPTRRAATQPEFKKPASIRRKAVEAPAVDFSHHQERVAAAKADLTAARQKKERNTAEAKRIAEEMIPSASIKAALDVSPFTPKTAEFKKPVSRTEKTEKKSEPRADLSGLRKRIDAAKAEAAAARQNKERARTEAKRIAEEMIPRNTLEKVTKTPIAPEASEKANLTEGVKNAFTAKFGVNAERYFDALPSDMQQMLENASAKKALAFATNKLITIHEDPNITAERITALHAVTTALKAM